MNYKLSSEVQIIKTIRHDIKKFTPEFTSYMDRTFIISDQMRVYDSFIILDYKDLIWDHPVKKNMFMMKLYYYLIADVLGYEYEKYLLQKEKISDLIRKAIELQFEIVYDIVVSRVIYSYGKIIYGIPDEFRFYENKDVIFLKNFSDIARGFNPSKKWRTDLAYYKKIIWEETSRSFQSSTITPIDYKIYSEEDVFVQVSIARDYLEQTLIESTKKEENDIAVDYKELHHLLNLAPIEESNQIDQMMQENMIKSHIDDVIEFDVDQYEKDRKKVARFIFKNISKENPIRFHVDNILTGEELNKQVGTNWFMELKKWVQEELHRNRVLFTRPNKRYLYLKTFMPQMIKNKPEDDVKRLIIYWDVSSSMGPAITKEIFENLILLEKEFGKETRIKYFSEECFDTGYAYSRDMHTALQCVLDFKGSGTLIQVVYEDINKNRYAKNSLVIIISDGNFDLEYFYDERPSGIKMALVLAGNSRNLEFKEEKNLKILSIYN